MRPFCNVNVSWHENNVEAHASCIILQILCLTTKPHSSLKEETCTQQYMLEPILLFAIQTIASIWHTMMWDKVLGYKGLEYRLCTLVANKFNSLSITLWYNALPLITSWLCFPQIFDQTQYLHEYFSKSQLHSRLRHS